MKRVITFFIVLCFCITSVHALADLDISSINLHDATDEELESLRLAIVSEQRSRIVTKIVFDQENLRLGKGSSVKIAAKVTDVPDGVKEGKLIWETSDKSIATVQNGNIRGAGEGNAVITCSTTLSDGTEIYSNLTVNVYIPIKSIAFKEKNPSGYVGYTYSQEIIIQPGDATNKVMKYESSDPKVATVDSNGLLEIVGEGKTTITATSTDGSEKTASYTFTAKSASIDTGKLSNRFERDSSGYLYQLLIGDSDSVVGFVIDLDKSGNSYDANYMGFVYASDYQQYLNVKGYSIQVDNKTYNFTSSEKTSISSSVGSTSVPLVYSNASLDKALKAMINAKEIKLSIDWGAASTATVIVTLNSRTNSNEFNTLKQVIKSLSDAGYFDVPHNYSKADLVTITEK